MLTAFAFVLHDLGALIILLPKVLPKLFELINSDHDSWIEQLERLIVGMLVPKIIMGCCKENQPKYLVR